MNLLLVFKCGLIHANLLVIYNSYAIDILKFCTSDPNFKSPRKSKVLEELEDQFPEEESLKLSDCPHLSN